MAVADVLQGAQAAEYLQELRDKLAEKVYNSGRFYVRRQALDAAVVYFREVVDNFPQTRFAPMALESLVETYDRLGYVEEAEAQRERLLRDYPESPEAQEVAAQAAG